MPQPAPAGDFTLGTTYFTLQQPDKAAALIKQSLALHRETGDLTGLVDSIGAMGWIAYNNGCYAEAEAHWQERRQLLRQLRTPHSLASNQYEFAMLALFNRGDLDSARLLAEEIQTVALAINNPGNRHRTLLLFGFLAGLHENYAACRQFFQEIDALNQPYFPFMMSWQQTGLCLAACGLDELPAARQHLQQVLRISLTHHWPAEAAKGLTFAAIIAAQSGKPEQATELLGLVFHHPLSPKGWLAQWPLITRLRTELEVTLTPAYFQITWKRSATLDLLATAKEQLAELTGES
jgi:tetratricopeptide (TPR) repeat protein